METTWRGRSAWLEAVAMATVMGSCGSHRTTSSNQQTPQGPSQRTYEAPATAAHEICIISAGAPTTVAIFDAMQDGDGPPLRTLTLQDLTMSIGGVGYDREAGEIFVSAATSSLYGCFVTYGAVFAYPSNAYGQALPRRVLSGPHTGLSGPSGIVVDDVHDELIVTNPAMTSITTYPRTASGDFPPARTIGSPGNVDYSPCVADGGASFGPLDFDQAADDLIVVGHFGSFVKDYSLVLAYPRTATGIPAASAVIGGGPFGNWEPLIAAIDQATDDRWMIGVGDYPNHNSYWIAIFPQAASGNAQPSKEIAGAATGLVAPRSLTIDPVRREVFVANTANNSITVYPLSASGNIPPIRKIAGAATGLNQPSVVAICR